MTKLTFACVILIALPLCAQDDFEIQVYGSDAVAKGSTMVELHSNFTSRRVHETLEITHGFTSWFETGFYIFTSGQYEGSHIRPRARVPEEWQWPVGVSLSTEFGYVKPRFSDDPWSWELRPIVDKDFGHYPSIDLNLPPDWEFNAGVGFSRGPTIVKFIVGRRFHR